MTDVKSRSQIGHLTAFLAVTIDRLQKGYLQDNPHSRAKIAKLRHVSSQTIGESPETWEFLIDGFPDELIGKGNSPTTAERIAFCTLTLYASHQQSQSQPMYIKNGAGNGESWRPDGKHSLGAAVRKFVDQQAKGDTPLEKNPAFKRLVNIINSHELDEQAIHLRGLIQLLKSQDIALDYTSLAWDLYRLQFPETKKEVTLRWGRQVYRNQKTDDTPTTEQ
jgi:hypothetical protein